MIANMIIHVVKAGETVYSIARDYDVSVTRLIQDNQLASSEPLVVGQTIVVLFPSEVHTVAPGETLLQIAQQYGVTINQLYRNNPVLRGLPTVYPGQTLVIAYEDAPEGDLSVNGYAYPYIDREVLRQTLPYLTYITIFTYGFTPEGELIGIDDQEVIDIAREYGVGPFMLISTLTSDGTFSNSLASTLLNNPQIQDTLIDNILANMKQKNYYGLDIDFEYIYPQERQLYVDFIAKVTERLNAQGYPVMTALAPKTSTQQKGTLYESHDYGSIGAVSNLVLIMTYEWGYTYGPPMAVAPLNKVREVVEYAVTQIAVAKILMGIPNYGYDWTLPYVKGESRAKAIGNVEAVQLAAETGSEISFDPVAMAPYFTYTAGGKEHEVWFEDARSIDAKFSLAKEFGLLGVGYWNLMKFFPQNWLVLNARFRVNKVLE